MEKIKKFKQQFPDAYYFDENHLDKLEEYLQLKKIMLAGEHIKYTEKPGEGNMNFVRRVVTNKRSLIFKQAHPWVEKYPDIIAPVERITVEATYYQRISDHSLFRPYTPAMLHFDPQNVVMILEDLGEGTDFTFIYKKAHKIHENELGKLVEYLSALHHLDEQKVMPFPENMSLRQLNHEHIFYFPYQENNGFDLDQVQPGLQELSIPVKTDETLKAKIAEFGQRYLSAGSALIHGDFYPGSWLSVGEEVKVIDPEFAYVGFAEFDVGVMSAHLLMAGMSKSQVRQAWQHYKKGRYFKSNWVTIYCGIELLRRLIGLAQLPLSLTLDEKSILIDMAISFIKSPENHEFL